MIESGEIEAKIVGAEMILELPDLTTLHTPTLYYRSDSIDVTV